jgi:predicted heme/steroid binding protein
LEKKDFGNTPYDNTGPFYAGTVTPVLHYCMGGIKINEFAQVLNNRGSVIHGLHAAGEIIGGVHGKTRLGGNALTECVVFGRVIGERIPLNQQSSVESIYSSNSNTNTDTKINQPKLRIITDQELKKHKQNDKDCWVAIEGKVYDFLDFVPEHPGSPEAITNLRGEDGTSAFKEAHPLTFLVDFEDKIVGTYQP